MRAMSMEACGNALIALAGVQMLVAFVSDLGSTATHVTIALSALINIILVFRFPPRLTVWGVQVVSSDAIARTQRVVKLFLCALIGGIVVFVLTADAARTLSFGIPGMLSMLTVQIAYRVHRAAFLQ